MKTGKHFPLATYVLIFLNVSIFLVQLWKNIDLNDPISALNWGVNFTPFTLDGQYWRLFSSTFIHYNIFHLGFNLFALYSIGRNVELQVGSLLFSIVYLTCGILASSASSYYNLFVFSMGASGAIFGLYGFELILSLKSNWQDKKLIRTSIVSFIIYLIVITFIGSKLFFDNAAHIGGAISGIVLGVLFLVLHEIHFPKIAGITFAASFLVFLIIPNLPDYQVKYFKAFQHFINIDDKTVDTYNESFSDDYKFAESLKKLDTKWDSLVYHFDSLQNMPPSIEEDIDLIRRLQSFRKNEIRYFITGIERESYIYHDSIGIVRQNLRNAGKFNHPLRLEGKEPKEDQPSGNEKEPVTVYYDENWKPSSVINADYYRVGIQDSLGRWDGWVYDYYISGEIQMKGMYKKDAREGIFLFYSKENTYEAAGRMKDNYNIGKWEYFHPNGKMAREMRFNDRAYLLNAWDEFGIQRVNEGNGHLREWHENGITKYYEKYKDGLLDSISYGNHESGKLHYKEYYVNGYLKEGISYSEDGSTYTYDISTFIPHPLKGDTFFNNYVNNFFEEEETKGYDTSIELLFNVDDNYRPYNVRVLGTDDSKLISAGKKLILNGPDWVPAKAHGQEIIYPDKRITINVP
ncbi:rhomboid family intramembrane serine protease [Fulvivirga lutea]|uniref:Rhomboid family intramembrane serine protease n=1 Tax=Fulvivirga lutea TaxID=2810512 RepID=A0A974WJD5_9BACT|nr:rhomboid family intramembrane serine protease [Fulvivirga lutea]QSE98873.1 rhomboid family intramembrane serine protease [Fulvivirga lutea]